MRFSMVALLSLLLSGCVLGGMTPDQLAAMRVVSDQNTALAKAHKITFVEAATRTNASIAATMGGTVPEQQALLNSYRLALASQVDAGQMTPEVAEYQQQQRVANLNEADRQKTAAAIQQLVDDHARAIDAARAQRQMNQPVTCETSAGVGLVLTTTTCR